MKLIQDSTCVGKSLKILQGEKKTDISIHWNNDELELFISQNDGQVLFIKENELMRIASEIMKVWNMVK